MACFNAMSGLDVTAAWQLRHNWAMIGEGISSLALKRSLRKKHPLKATDSPPLTSSQKNLRTLPDAHPPEEGKRGGRSVLRRLDQAAAGLGVLARAFLRLMCLFRR